LKYLVLFIFFIKLFSFDIDLSAKIFDTIFSGIVNQKKIDIYVDDKKYYPVIKKANKLHLVKLKKDATIILIAKKCIYTKKPVFVLKKSLLKCPNVIGGFYWDFGEPLIILYKLRLDLYGFKVKSYLKEYVE